MPLLSYSAITDYPFQPFTKIYSADINSMFATLTTLLNTTKLDSTNVQLAGLTRDRLASGTANYAVYNSGTGALTEAAQLPTAQGGLGSDLSPSSSLQAGQAIVVNAAGTGFILSPASGSSQNLYNYFNLG